MGSIAVRETTLEFPLHETPWWVVMVNRMSQAGRAIGKGTLQTIVAERRNLGSYVGSTITTEQSAQSVWSQIFSRDSDSSVRSGGHDQGMYLTYRYELSKDEITLSGKTRSLKSKL